MNGVINYMEVWVEQNMETLLKEYKGCTCEMCKRDIFALALNNLPHYYVVTSKGTVLTKLQGIQQQFSTDIIIEVTKAIEKVGTNPNHK